MKAGWCINIRLFTLLWQFHYEAGSTGRPLSHIIDSTDPELVGAGRLQATHGVSPLLKRDVIVGHLPALVRQENVTWTR